MKSMFTLFLITMSCVSAIAQPGNTPAAFGTGNIVVYRVGNGIRALKAASTLVFLDEYTPAGALVQSVAIPRKTGAADGLTAQGTTTSEGMLNKTADGKYLVFTGYNADTSIASVNTSSSSTVARAAGRVDAGGTVSLTTFGPGAFSAGGIRGAASADGTTFYLAGSNGGIRKATFGDSATTRVSTLAGNLSNFRAVSVYNGQLYASTVSGNTFRLGTIGTGLPTDTGAVVTKLPGIPTGISPNQFLFADLSAAVPGFDVLYVADNGTTTGGIRKYSLVSGSWVSNGRALPAITGTIGLTGTVNAGKVKLYTTTGSTTGATYVIYSLTDTSYNKTISQTFTTVATAAANTAFRGVAMAPEAINSSLDTDYFRSAASGNWNATATWESSTDSISWHVATLTPGANAAAVTIRSPHVVTVTANVSARKPTVNTGGTLNVNTGIVLTTD